MKKYLQAELCVPLPDIHKADELLFHAVINKTSPSSAVNDLFELIHRPIIAFDTSFRLIAYAFPRPFPFDPWEEIASTESLSDAYIHENNALFYQEKMYQLKCSSYFNTDMTTDFPQVDGPIMSEGKLIGYVGICVSCDEEVDDIAYINDRLAEALSLLITRSARNNKAQKELSEGIWERLLSDEVIDDEEVSEMELRLKPAYHIAIMTAQSGQMPTLQYIKGCLEQNDSALQTHIDSNEHLVVLYHGLDESPSADSESAIINELSQYSEKYQLYSGISDKFYHLRQSPVARLQADVSIEIGRKQTRSERIYSFRNLYKDILCSYALERYGLSPSVPPVMRSSANESEKIESLLPTLEAFIESDCSQEKTAVLLGIHKNTVNYRLRHFTELTGADPSNASDILQLKLGLMLHNYSIDLNKRVREDTANDRKNA